LLFTEKDTVREREQGGKETDFDYSESKEKGKESNGVYGLLPLRGGKRRSAMVNVITSVTREKGSLAKGGPLREEGRPAQPSPSRVKKEGPLEFFLKTIGGELGKKSPD